MGPRLLKTQLIHRLGRMDSYDNLNSPRMPICNSLVSLDDGQRGGQAHQIIQHSDTFEQPPGAEFITQLTTLDNPWQAEDLLLRPTTGYYHGHSSREPTPLSFDSQSDESETTFLAPSATNSSISPAPRASHVFKTRPPFLRMWQFF